MRTHLALAAGLLLLGCPAPSTTDGGTTQSDGGTPPADAGGQTNTDGGAANPPQLTTLTASVSSRTGRDLTVHVVAKDRDLNIVSAWVKLQDTAGAPVNGIDTNRDGMPDLAEGLVTFDTKKLVGETLTADATLPGVFARAHIAKVAVTVIDATSLRSEELTADVQDQLVRGLASPCDPTYVADRCGPGYGCRGTPPTCQEGVAPQIGRMGFFRSTVASQGPAILMEGTEPEDDLATIRFTFKNAGGMDISIDSNGDGTPDLLTFDYDATNESLNGNFFVSLQAGVGLDTQVPTLVATPIDAAGHTGPAKSINPTAVPTRAAGQSCDARGFDTCLPDLICTPRLLSSTTNKCVAAATVRGAECAAAPVLNATTTGARYSGVTKGTSLWDAPAGCSSNDPKGRPDAVVKVRLATRTNKLTLTTVSASTNFDTALYVLQTCPTSTAGALGCNDDTPNGTTAASTLELADMPAGDYLVVIDSFNEVGGAFELTATVE